MSPYFLLSILIGGSYGAAFHVWQGKTVKGIIHYLCAGILGFAIGQMFAYLWEWHLLAIGPLYVVEASIISWGTLFLTRWLRG